MDDTRTEIDIAALIGSRICHDLISPIGAIGNGIELLSMSGGSAGPELDLISQSAQNASARIGFFRIAYGTAGPQVMTRNDVRAILAGMTAQGRLQVDWQPEDPQPRRDVRLAFLALQCCETALPYDGTVTIVRQADWQVRAEAGTVQADPALWQALAAPHPPAAVTAATVQFALLPELARAQARPLSADWSAGHVSVRF